MNNYVTLFDKNYFSRGMLLLNSLRKVSENGFTLYILAIDDIVYDFFNKNDVSSVVCFDIAAITEMYPVLDRIREERTRGEFCWTLASFSIQYVIRKYELNACTYLDSDIYFFDNPQRLISEAGNKSVIITEHNFYKEYDTSDINGKFCVQFMSFKNTQGGDEVLEWWRNKCEEWCYNRHEDGKFGDQRYLDDWESRFKHIVYNCKNIGCGLAPWNCQKYELNRVDGTWMVTDKLTKVCDALVFYHFHDLYKLSDGRWSLSGYEIPIYMRDIYYLYISELRRIEREYPELASNAVDLRDINESHMVLKSIYRGIKSMFYWYNRFTLPVKNVVNEIEID